MNFFATESKACLITISLLAVCIFSACAKEEGSKRATVFDVFGITETNPDENRKEIVFEDDGFIWERNKNAVENEEDTTTGFDGSKITTLKDSFGNVTYQRIFSNHLRLDRIMIVSSPDGEQVVYLYGQDGGKVVRMTGEKDRNFLEMTADDLADLADLRQPIRTDSFDEPKISSSLPVKNAAVPNRSQEQYSEDFYNNFPRINENDSQTPAQNQAQTEKPENKQQTPDKD